MFGGGGGWGGGGGGGPTVLKQGGYNLIKDRLL